MPFTRKVEDISIEEYIHLRKSTWKENWRAMSHYGFKQDVAMWLELLNHDKMKALTNEAYEQVFLYRWSQAMKKNKEITKGLFSSVNFLLQVHGCIHQEKVIVSINPSSKCYP